MSQSPKTGTSYMLFQQAPNKMSSSPKTTPMRYRPTSRLNPGQSLRRIREHLGLSLRDVYRASAIIAARHYNLKLLIPPSRLCQIETKGLAPNIYRIYALSLIYESTMGELLSLYGLNRRSLREYLRAS
jgi:hypothetical protein